MNSYITEKYRFFCQIESDINEHLPVLKKYTEECDTVCEMGVRKIVSTWAFLAGNPEKLLSLDLYNPSFFGGNLQEVYDSIKDSNIDFTFIEHDSLTFNLPDCDLLFIDTWHDYLQLKKELYRHHAKVKKYIILHDTTSFGTENEILNSSEENFVLETNLPKGLLPAIDEFLFSNKDWILWEKRANNNGLTILKRVDG